ncbi:peroxidase 60-like [Humulus lupulus]|uniref:peroxidase 60-like n=1 Tax=Humulus lupulus TaxID=3486 RepID=UPI002B416EEC|nr:peroxidase 60-like [Humulus lupulus]
MVCNMKNNNRVLAMATIGLFLILGLSEQCYGALQPGYYNQKCFITTTTGAWPLTKSQTTEVNVEATVKAAMKLAFTNDSTIAAALLRMQFHDCFVKGCDASILLDGKQSEKTATPNLSVRGYEVIDSIKKTLEKSCRQVVSCADIIVMATRDAVSLASGGKVNYGVETGRLDGKVSNASNVNLPGPTISVSDSIKAFQQKGLGVNDMVYLLGGHTVGVAHCFLFQDRLYNFNGTNKPDPTMDPMLVKELKPKCPQKLNIANTVFLDQTPSSSMVVDKAYFNQLVRKRGILKIDQDLAIARQTKDVVSQLAGGKDYEFAQKFGQAMVKLGRVEVITDTRKGEIRRSCNLKN